jgi:hypothetical protein
MPGSKKLGDGHCSNPTQNMSGEGVKQTPTEESPVHSDPESKGQNDV